MGEFIKKSNTAWKNAWTPENTGQSIGAIGSGVMGMLQAGLGNAQIQDTSGEQMQIDNRANTQFGIGDFDNLQAMQTADIKSDYGKSDVGRSTGENIKGTLGGIASGAAAGASVGGPLGAVIGGATGLLAGIGGWIAGDAKAKREAERLNREAQEANRIYHNNFANNARNISNSMFNAAALNIAAFGGDLYKASKYASNSMAKGGQLNIDNTFTNGVVEVNEGQSHEQNKLGGVPMGVDNEGVPNLVEEGEVIYNDYVYSNRLKPSDKMLEELGFPDSYSGKTFAEIAKEISKESKERPNDPISKAGLDDGMIRLQTAQEQIREKNRERQMKRDINSLSPEGLDMLAQMVENGGQYGLGGVVRKFDDGTPGVIEGPVSRGVYAKNILSGRIGTLLDMFSGSMRSTKEENDFANKFRGNTQAMTESDWNTLYDLLMNLEKRSPGTLAAMDLENSFNYDDYLSIFNNSNISNTPETQNNAETNISLEPTTVTAEALKMPNFKEPQAEVQNPQNGGLVGRRPVDGLRYGLPGFGTPKAIVQNPNLAGLSIAQPSIPVLPILSDEEIDDAQKDADSYIPNDAFVDLNYKPTKVKRINGPKASRDEWLRYAPAIGSGLQALSDWMGITNKEEYDDADMIRDARNNIRNVSFTPIGQRLAYNPIDINYELNRAQNANLGTQRNILNAAAGNRGAAMSGLLALDRQGAAQRGDLLRQALQYNNQQRQAVADFNRATDIQNANLGLHAAQMNTKADIERAGLAVKEAQFRDAIKSAATQAQAANRTNLFTNLGNVGRDALFNDWTRQLAERGVVLSPFNKPRTAGGKINRIKKKR